MKILIIHGDNILESEKRLNLVLNNSKSKGYRIETINKNDLSFQEKMTSYNLFREKTVFLLEDIGILEKSDYIWLKNNTETKYIYLIIYSASSLNATILKYFPKNTKTEEFKIPQLLWKFLDSFYPGNNKKILQLLNSCVENNPIDFVFSMLSRHLKDLYWVKIEPKGLEYQEWRITKLQNQADKFSNKLLKIIIKEMAIIDLKVKRSQADMIDSLDLLILSKLE